MPSPLRVSIGLWLINVTAVIGLMAWIFFDPVFVSLAEDNLLKLSIERVQSDPFYVVDRRSQWLSAAGMVVVLTLSCISWGAMLAGLVVGPAALRSLRAWLIVVSLACLWMSAASHWRQVAWQGKRHRLQARVDEFERFAAPLREQWPSEDGHSQRLGAYMAYPIGRPSVLVLLTLPKIPGMEASVSVVERGDAGQIRFQLAGQEQGDWLEWHPAGSLPRSFVGGIQDVFELDRYQAVAPGWYLVHYSVPQVRQEPRQGLTSGQPMHRA